MLSTRLCPLSPRISRGSGQHILLSLRPFSTISPRQACPKSSCAGKNTPSPASHNPGQDSNSNADTRSLLRASFWSSRPTWKRASINTLRCLVGCTIGDFSALWVLQTYLPGLGMGTIMGLSMASGISTSILLETMLLKHGPDKLPLPAAFRTATGMSLVSMLAMEAAENAVDWHLTGGVVAVQDPAFWAAAAVSIAAGFLAPLPYNYVRLRRWGRSCH
ncbi:hypothetical protein P170DRAFT_382672 [Aspergillus steynii IBT 23096]|uniref:DUF4396 domain-containing protein n=1 Tax=Aspergillus steynii IBT 23096 TaxID=1392250 RepID=A0A2I2GEG6_9EURO|nr:uncharacterized protein P170DRAFT_382672 [Aspergillus steynii IBT 23096]PLB51273.1 hypothetical protein P170DRAFT_382672 [Aspergillus steynii IBT 23096]